MGGCKSDGGTATQKASVQTVDSTNGRAIGQNNLVLKRYPDWLNLDIQLQKVTKGDGDFKR